MNKKGKLREVVLIISLFVFVLLLVTLFPRLLVNNGYKIELVNGEIIEHCDFVSKLRKNSYYVCDGVKYIETNVLRAEKIK